MATTEKCTVFNDDGDEVALPTVFVVCPRCAGKGTHDHPAFSNGITAEEWNRDWDDESREQYMGGGYDVPCSNCCGQRVVARPDRKRFTKDQKRWLRQQEQELAQLRADERSERFMCGEG